MLLLLTEARDPLIDEVTRGLQRLGVTSFRWDVEDPVLDIALRLGAAHDGAVLTLAGGRRLDLSAVRGAWWRRGALRLRVPESLGDGLDAAVEAQWAVVVELLEQGLRALPSLGATRSVGKLLQLRTAREVGLAIPESLVAGSRELLADFLRQHPGAVTKSLTESAQLDAGGRRLVGPGTISLDLDGLEEQLLPVYVQARVPRDMELRVVSLDGEHFAMAALHGPDSPLDGRLASPRCVPYALPEDVALALTRFTERLNLDLTVSDLIVTPEGEHVFLESNPEGWMEQVDAECGYGLPGRIAQVLRRRLADD